MPDSNTSRLNAENSTSAPYINYGWMGSIATFLELPVLDWLETLSDNYHQLYQHRATTTQRQAWLDCGEILHTQLAQLVNQRSESGDWTLIFEYELPREGGRRPDLVLLGAGQILVFEFKQKRSPSSANFDQVAAYARDLATYHSGSHFHPVTPIVVPTRQVPTRQVPTRQPSTSEKLASGSPANSFADSSANSEIVILHPNRIATYLSQLETRSPSIHPQTWLTSDYAPLPTIVQAARRIFQHDPLPAIKRAHSARIPDLITYLNGLAETAYQHQERHLVLITGAPGAGKTLVGLQFVYQSHWQAVSDRQAVFLSGNAPLVAVLQYALKSRVFVQAARNFYIDHEVRRQKAPREPIIVFDEAQRAWDAERMAEKYGVDSAAAGTMLRIAERSPDWCVLVGLIGEGQEIHVGEEGGIEQWNQGLEQVTSRWHVHCPPEQAHHFTAVDADRLHVDELFNLTTSLRTHLATHVQTWVADVLLGQFDRAAQLFPSLSHTGFDAYLTRDLDAAKTYCRDRYHHQSDKRYGLLASSRAKNLTQYNIPNDYKTTQRLKVGAWYIDPPDSPESCCALNAVATEFACQGLELDFPIVCWGDDLIWKDGTWVTKSRQRQVRNPLRLRLNSYRVLLTRGRDGFVVFVPPDSKLDSTYEALRSAGLPRLA